ncbi:MAG: response regulator [Deltaproteobacteria bacterium]|nr:response regulator [Deltaproteobacteria bacterium]
MKSHKVRALVVDDSPMLRKSVVAALRRIDALHCVEAGDGGEGLKRLSKEHFDILLTDINMPVMDGLKLIAAVRQPPLGLKIPIVVITTESDSKDRDRALALGATRYMVKPVQAPEVIAAVKELLDLP